MLVWMALLKTWPVLMLTVYNIFSFDILALLCLSFILHNGFVDAEAGGNHFLPTGAPERKRHHTDMTPNVPPETPPEHFIGNGKKRSVRASSGRFGVSNFAAGESTSSGGGPVPEKANKGLRHFSMKVCKKVEEKQCTSYNEVADELVHEFLSSDNSRLAGEKPAFDEKNIRRRVYDALNVLMAMDIISKEKKEIKWIGLPSNAHKDKEQLEKEKGRLEANIRRKRDHLQQLIEQQVTYHNLVRRNATCDILATSHSDISRGISSPTLEMREIDGEDMKIALPFIVINTNNETMIQCEMTENRNAVMFQFSAPFEVSPDKIIITAAFD